MICNSFKVLINNQALKHFKTAQKLFSKQCYYLNLISDFNFHIKYHSEKANVKINTFIKILNCISNDKDEKI